MQAVLKKIYTLVPLVVVVFFFQNCGHQNKISASTGDHTYYEGISNIDPDKLRD